MELHKHTYAYFNPSARRPQRRRARVLFSGIGGKETRIWASRRVFADDTWVDVTAGCISKTQCPEGIPPKVISVGVRSHRTLSVMVRENHYNHYLKNKNKNKQTHTTHNKHAETLQKYYTTLCACLWPWSPSTFPKKITPPPPTQVSPPAVSWGWHCHALLEQNANAAAA